MMRKWMVWIGLILSPGALPLQLSAADLKPETVSAWDTYVQATEQSMQVRLSPGHSFLWADEDASRNASVRQGAVQVAPMDGHGYKAVPNGLIHHWIGVVFIPNTSLTELTCLVRDYDHYKDIYRPLVVDSRLIDQSSSQDRFTMRWVHKALFVTSAIDTEYSSRSVRVSDRRSYSISSSTRVQEIQSYGDPGEHELPAGQGSGFVWKLFSVTRYEERDGGVYVEIEAVVLTRDIPVSVRLMVKPIVAKLSRNSLLVSLTQTRDAAQAKAAKPLAPIQISEQRGNGASAPARGKLTGVSFSPR